MSLRVGGVAQVFPASEPGGRPTRRSRPAPATAPRYFTLVMAGHAGRTGGRNRTRNPRLWRPSLYRIELHPWETKKPPARPGGGNSERGDQPRRRAGPGRFIHEPHTRFAVLPFMPTPFGPMSPCGTRHTLGHGAGGPQRIYRPAPTAFQRRILRAEASQMGATPLAAKRFEAPRSSTPRARSCLAALTARHPHSRRGTHSRSCPALAAPSRRCPGTHGAAPPLAAPPGTPGAHASSGSVMSRAYTIPRPHEPPRGRQASGRLSFPIRAPTSAPPGRPGP